MKNTDVLLRIECTSTADVNVVLSALEFAAHQYADDTEVYVHHPAVEAISLGEKMFETLTPSTGYWAGSC